MTILNPKGPSIQITPAIMIMRVLTALETTTEVILTRSKKDTTLTSSSTQMAVVLRKEIATK
jgi:hypothetical protein